MNTNDVQLQTNVRPSNTGVNKYKVRSNDPLSQDDSVFSLSFIESMMADIEHIFNLFSSISYIQLTDKDRKRLMSSGIKRYGFIDKVSDLAEINPKYSPLHFSSAKMKGKLRDIEFCRSLLAKINMIERLVSNNLFLYSDEVYRMSLSFYNYIRQLARTGDSGAIAIVDMLEPFFRRTRRASEEPTEREVKRDVRALLHGTKDGEVIIRNERPHMTGGKHMVVDETHKAHGAWKATREEN